MLIFSQPKGLEVQKQGVGRSGIFQGLFSWSQNGHLLLSRQKVALGLCVVRVPIARLGRISVMLD